MSEQDAAEYKQTVYKQHVYGNFCVDSICYPGQKSRKYRTIEKSGGTYQVIGNYNFLKNAVQRAKVEQKRLEQSQKDPA